MSVPTTDPLPPYLGVDSGLWTGDPVGRGLSRAGSAAAASRPLTSGLRYWAGETPTARVNLVVNVPTLLYPTMVTMSATFINVVSSIRLASNNRTAVRYFP